MKLRLAVRSLALLPCCTLSQASIRPHLRAHLGRATPHFLNPSSRLISTSQLASTVNPARCLNPVAG